MAQNELDLAKRTTVNKFRAKRGKILAKQIKEISSQKGRPINILDVGGRSAYWKNVNIENVSKITILNYEESELDSEDKNGIFENTVGDARNLIDYENKSIDLVHSNSVIEHVGAWQDMEAMAHELQRVGNSGWVQTPAWEFPIEPHFRAPFLHWFGQPLRRKLLMMSNNYRGKSLGEKRLHVDRINLLSKAEVKDLFPGSDILVERMLLLPKSFVVRW